MDVEADAEAARLAELAERIFRGDRKAEGELCARITPGIRQILKRRVHNFALVDDLTQDVLLTSIERLRRERLADPSRLEAFVMQTARRMAEGDQRKQYRRKTDSVPDLEDVTPNTEPQQTDPVEVAEMAALVHKVLQELPCRDRLILVMYYLEGKDKAIICRELGIDESHVKVVLYRARRRFLELLEQRGMKPHDLFSMLLLI
jgi:RNA polymerase sigma-70 factor (ECF subfamily)